MKSYRKMWLTRRSSKMLTFLCTLMNLDDTSLINELARIRELSSGDVRRHQPTQRKIVDEMRDPE